MATKITFFNHKGGVGKTTLTFNVARAMQNLGYKVLLIDADPQCSLTALHFGKHERDIDELLSESEDEDGNTIYSVLRPIILGRGDLKMVDAFGEVDEPCLIAGDVLLSDYERALYKEWPDCYNGDPRAYDVVCALSRAVDMLAADFECDVVFYDIGPNIGALNRVALLDCDYFAVPVEPDLFSLRALSTVGISIAQWVEEWERIRKAAKNETDRRRLLNGNPKFLGYLTSRFKLHSKRTTNKAYSHEYWENRIIKRVREKIIDPLTAANAGLIGTYAQKLGEVQNWQSLSSAAMQEGVGIGDLKGYVNPGQNKTVNLAAGNFQTIAKEIIKRIGLKPLPKAAPF